MINCFHHPMTRKFPELIFRTFFLPSFRFRLRWQRRRRRRCRLSLRLFRKKPRLLTYRTKQLYCSRVPTCQLLQANEDCSIVLDDVIDIIDLEDIIKIIIIINIINIINISNRYWSLLINIYFNFRKINNDTKIKYCFENFDFKYWWKLVEINNIIFIFLLNFEWCGSEHFNKID